MNQKVVTVILDGWGIYKAYPGNAIALAKTPTFDHLWDTYPHATLEVSGEAIGLPHGQMGTSEVNHMVLGAGKILYQDLLRINHAIDDGAFYHNQVLLSAINHTKKHHSALHIMGLLSDGGVHSHQHHLFSLLKLAAAQKCSQVYLHLFTDGRDTLPHSSLTYISDLMSVIQSEGIGEIKSLVGRYYAMDRDTNWDRTQNAFDLITQAKGKVFTDPIMAIKASHQQQITDEFIQPLWFGSKKEGVIQNNDAVIFANFRIDRTRQLTRKILQAKFDNLFFATMTQYHPDFPTHIVFPPIAVDNPLGKIISDAHLPQVRITETEKFAHLTFFLNCKNENPYEGEDRIMIDTYSDIATHDLKPQMRAPEITSQVVEAMEKSTHRAIFTNICNGDMVGHTGNLKAAIKAVEVVDKCLKDILKAAQQNDYHLIITADHGNCEEMVSEQSGEILTAHTTNPVPFILVSKNHTKLNRSQGNLTDVTATVLQLLRLKPDCLMTGKSFI